ncbi:glycosyltransferase family 4 protein [Sphingomonas sp.]|uniref:glycosyltransferase family 4 protein n=1 Tax=Sphingomonas sp. TaxID=28214 RepID=UPI003B3A87DE
MTDRRRMLVLCPFPQGVAAGQRLKYEQYLDDWRSAGWEVVVSPFLDLQTWQILYEKGHILAKVTGVARGHARRLRDLARIRSFDLVYVFMWVTPFGTTALERAVRRLAPKLVYDAEDNILLPVHPAGDDPPNPITRFLKRPAKPRYLIRHADHVIVASPLLEARYRALNAHHACSCIPPSIDAAKFVPSERARRSVPVIGWTGTFSSRPYLDLLRDVFTRLAQRRRFRLRVIGNFDYALPGIDLEVVRWTAAREVEDLQAIDIGIYPLPDNEWSAGKANLKPIQYMGVGLPTVASAAGATARVVRDGITGLLVASDDEWVSALERLIDDVPLRARLGAQARADVVAHYSTAAIAARYRAILASVAAG